MGPVALRVCTTCGGIWTSTEGLATLTGAGAEIFWKLWWKVQARVRGGGSENALGSGCPDCRQPLTPAQDPSLPGHRFCECRACAGLWVSDEGLAGIAARLSDVELEVAGLIGETPDPRAERLRETVRAVLPETTTCGECGQPNAKNAPLCWACGKSLRDLSREMRCPRCDGPTERVKGNDVEMSACGFCGGIWTRDLDLRALLFFPDSHQRAYIMMLAEVAGRRPATPAEGLPCPHCRRGMVRKQVGALAHRPVNTCDECAGRFLDLDQLQEVVLGIALRS
jgi:Zn-finger nucleic acid-binding protein